VAELEKSEGSAAPRSSAASEEGESKRERSAPPTASRRARRSLVDTDKDEKLSWNDDIVAGEHRKLVTKRAKGLGERSNQ